MSEITHELNIQTIGEGPMGDLVNAQDRFAKEPLPGTGTEGSPTPAVLAEQQQAPLRVPPGPAVV